jgi:transcriptional regulator with XRE-family HTH domain
LEDFRDRIDQLLIPKRWKKPQLAQEAGVNYSTIKTWYNRRESVPNAKDLYCVAKALDTSVEYLLTGQQSPSTKKYEDPVKMQLLEYIENIDDHDQLVEIRGAVKILNSLALQTSKGAKKENTG